MHVHDALGIDACAIYDLSNFEYAPEPSGTEQYRLILDGGSLFSSDDTSQTPAQQALLALLGSSEENQESVPILSTFSTQDSLAVSRFLATGGQTFDASSIPSWFATPLPPGVTSIHLLPISSIDKSPIALIAAISKDERFEFTLGHQAYLAAVGQILTSSFLRRQLLQSDRAKQVFVGNISHELRSEYCHLLLSPSSPSFQTRRDAESSSLLHCSSQPRFMSFKVTVSC